MIIFVSLLCGKVTADFPKCGRELPANQLASHKPILAGTTVHPEPAGITAVAATVVARPSISLSSRIVYILSNNDFHTLSCTLGVL